MHREPHHFLLFLEDQYCGATVNPSIEKEKYFAGTVKNSRVPLLYLSKEIEGESCDNGLDGDCWNTSKQCKMCAGLT